MNYLDYMTENEAAILAAVLVNGGGDSEVMELFWKRDDFPSAIAECIAYAVDSAHINGDEINVMSVFEELDETDDADECPIELLNAICQAIQPRDKTLAILRGEQ